MNKKEEIKPDNLKNDTADSLDEIIKKYKKENPKIEEALELFGISSGYYESALSSFQNTKTYVTTSTLLPEDNGKL